MINVNLNVDHMALKSNSAYLQALDNVETEEFIAEYHCNKF